MHSIFLNKSIRLFFLLIFILCNNIVIGQNKVDLSDKKPETKRFIDLLMKNYGSTLCKIYKQGDSNVTKEVTTQETLPNGKHSLRFNISLDKTVFTFNKSKLDTVKRPYEGESNNLKELFDNLEYYSEIPSRTKLMDPYFKEDLEVKLYADPGFIKRYYNRKWRTYEKPDRLSLSIFGGVNFSTAFVTPLQYSDEAELKTQIRRTNEGYLPGGIFGFSAGYSRYSHGVDIFFQRINNGCKFYGKNVVDWNTGYYGGNTYAPDSSKLSIPTGQWGIRYRYSNYIKRFSPYVIAGVYISYVSVSYKNSLKLNSQYLNTGFNLGLGLNFHPIYALDIHMAPVMNVSFNAIKKSELQTRFSSIALEVGIRYNFALGKTKNKTAPGASTSSSTKEKKGTSTPGKPKKKGKKESEKEN